jgi:hypothetical protein
MLEIARAEHLFIGAIDMAARGVKVALVKISLFVSY